MRKVVSLKNEKIIVFSVVISLVIAPALPKMIHYPKLLINDFLPHRLSNC